MDKVTSTYKMTLIDKKEILVGDYNTAKVSFLIFWNNFFSNTVSGLNIPEYSNCEPLANNISDPVLKYVGKCRNHPRYLL